MASPQIQSEVSWIKYCQIQSDMCWIKHYQEERLYFSPAMVMEPFRIYTRDGFSASMPAPIMMAFSSLAKRLFIPKTGGGGQDIFLPSVRGKTVLLLVELLRSGITNDIGPEESIKDVQDLMQLLEINGRIDVVRIDKGNNVNDKKHIQRAPLGQNILKSKSNDRNDHAVRDKPDISNFMASRDTDGDRELSNCSDIEYVQSTPTRYDKSWDKKKEDRNGHFMSDNLDFSNILMVSSDTDDDSFDKHFQSAQMSLDNAMAITAGNGKGSHHATNKPDSSNVIVLPSNTNKGWVSRNVSDNKLLPSKSTSHNKSSTDRGLQDGKGLCALDKSKMPNMSLVSSIGSKINTGEISNDIGQNNGFKNISRFSHDMIFERRTSKRFWPKTVLHSGSKKNLRKIGPMKKEKENDESKFKCKSDIKVAASKFTIKRSFDEVFEATEVSDESDNVSTYEDINNNASSEVILENEKNGSEALVEGQERFEGLTVRESSVDESIPEPQIEFLSLFNLCTHAQAEQIRARMAIKPTTSRLKRSRTKKKK